MRTILATQHWIAAARAQGLFLRVEVCKTYELVCLVPKHQHQHHHVVVIIVVVVVVVIIIIIIINIIINIRVDSRINNKWQPAL